MFQLLVSDVVLRIDEAWFKLSEVLKSEGLSNSLEFLSLCEKYVLISQGFRFA